MWIGVDVGGTKTAVLAVDDALQVQGRVVRPTVVESAEAVSRTVIDAIYATGIDTRQLAGIGIGIPGMVDPSRGNVQMAINLNIRKPLPLAAILTAEFGCPVALENDVRLAATGIQHHLECDNLAYLSIGTGVSAGLILNGHLHRGVSGMAGEIGFMTVQTAAGSMILEDVIAGPAIEKQAADWEEGAVSAETIYQMTTTHPHAAQLIKTVSSHIANTIYWLMITYDVDRIILGGGVSRAGDRFLQPILTALAKLRAFSPLAALMLPDDKIGLLSADFNAGTWGGIRLAQAQTTIRARRKEARVAEA